MFGCLIAIAKFKIFVARVGRESVKTLPRSTKWCAPLTQSGLSAIPIFGENASEERAENARLSSFVGAIAVGDLVKSTLGPKGMDKILQSLSNQGDVMVTNDGATILKSIALDNAAAKVLVSTRFSIRHQQSPRRRSGRRDHLGVCAGC